MNKKLQLERINDIFEGDNGQYRVYDEAEELREAVALIDELRVEVMRELNNLLLTKS